jgi:hypothetical protein
MNLSKFLVILEASVKNASEKYPLATLIIVCLLVAWVASQPLLYVLAKG